MRQIIVDFGTLDLFGHNVPLRIYGYGLMMVFGFLLGILLAQWRARRAGENPDVLAHCGLLALIGGILGARIAYVIQPSVWPQFANAPDPLVEILNVTSGGLVYYGGVLLATAMVLVYLRSRRLPIRRYFDILAVSLMVGLAFGRAGCLLNGCCFGERCQDHWFLAQRFGMFTKPLIKLDGRENPYSIGTEGPTPAYEYQLERGLLHPDERLANSYTTGSFKDNDRLIHHPVLHPPRYLHGRLERDQLAVLLGSRQDAEKKFLALAGIDRRISYQEWQKGLLQDDGLLCGSEFWDEATFFDSDHDGYLSFPEVWDYLAGGEGLTLPSRRELMMAMFDNNTDGELTGLERDDANRYLQADLYALADASRSEPVKPTQALGLANALIIAILLMIFYRLRTREGQVFALLMILYPITRFILESIRADNAHDILKGILTHNQYISMALTTSGVIMWLALSRLSASAGPVWAQRQGPIVHHVQQGTAGNRKQGR